MVLGGLVGLFALAGVALMVVWAFGWPNYRPNFFYKSREGGDFEKMVEEAYSGRYFKMPRHEIDLLSLWDVYNIRRGRGFSKGFLLEYGYYDMTWKRFLKQRDYYFIYDSDSSAFLASLRVLELIKKEKARRAEAEAAKKKKLFASI